MPDTLLGAGTCISKLRNFCKFKPYLITAKKSRGGGSFVMMMMACAFFIRSKTNCPCHWLTHQLTDNSTLFWEEKKIVFFSSLFVSFRQKNIIWSQKIHFGKFRNLGAPPLYLWQSPENSDFLFFPLFSFAFLNQEGVVFLLKSFSSSSSVPAARSSKF